MADACSRLLRELREVQSSKANTDIELKISEDNLFEWTAYINGPPDTPFEGGRFQLIVHCPITYPMAPPNVTFATPVFHPNVHWTTGEICLNVLKNNWTPAWTLEFVCRAIAALLADPNADSPLNCDAGNLVRSGDIRGYESIARMYCIEYATNRKGAGANKTEVPSGENVIQNSSDP